MSEKLGTSRQDMIKRMVELQKKFMDYEHQNGLDPVDYYAPKPGHILDGFREEYQQLANKLIDAAHSAVGSHR